LSDETAALARHRVARARESLEDARVLASAERWGACIGRLYYACFHAVSALLVARGLSTSKHSGARSLFNRHFVKSGIIAKEKASVYNDLFLRRQEADYLDYALFDEGRVRPWIPAASDFVEAVASVLEDELAQTDR